MSVYTERLLDALSRTVSAAENSYSSSKYMFTLEKLGWLVKRIIEAESKYTSVEMNIFEVGSVIATFTEQTGIPTYACRTILHDWRAEHKRAVRLKKLHIYRNKVRERKALEALEEQYG